MDFSVDAHGAAPSDAPPLSLPLQASLFLDFDGTLVELATRPNDVVADKRTLDLVLHLERYLDGRLAILSGRDRRFLSEQFGHAQVAYAGSHGQELCFQDGRTNLATRPPGLDEAARRMEWAAAGRSSVIVEQKTLGVALHYRMEPEAETWCTALATELAAEYGFNLQFGKMMVELRPAGVDKGGALARFMADPAFAGTIPIMVGDDVTDEPAFEAAGQHGGWGVLVGSARLTSARYRLDSVSAVHAWLKQALDR